MKIFIILLPEVLESWCLFQCKNCKQQFISSRISDQNSTLNSNKLHTDNNWTAWNLKKISFSTQLNVNSEHDRQDKKLTGWLPNQFGHCPLTGQYFEPCIWHKSTNWGHYLYTFHWRQDNHFMWSSEPHDSLAICRARGTVSFHSYF